MIFLTHAVKMSMVMAKTIVKFTDLRIVLQFYI